MEGEREDCERVVSRAHICEVLKQEGHKAELDSKGNVVVTCPWVPMEEGRKWDVTREWVTAERKKLAAWRKSIHRRVAHLSGDVWVTVKEQSGPAVQLRVCQKCDRPIKCLGNEVGCRCDCSTCQVHHHDVCDYGCINGRGCRRANERVFDQVVVRALAIVPRSKLNQRGIDATRSLLAAETVLLARKRRGNVWSNVPTDVVLLILNRILQPCKLRIRRKRAE